MELARIFSNNPKHNLLYLLNFLVASHFFLLIYINSSFLTTFVSDRIVGTLYVIGSAISAVALYTIAKVLRRHGNFRVLVVLAVVEFFVALGLATPVFPLFAVLLFLMHMALSMLILFSLDVFLEAYSPNENETGNIRGTFLTMQNLALILAPLVVGIVLTNGDFWRVYALSAVFLIPFLYIVIRCFRDFKDPPYDDFRLRETVGSLLKQDDLRNVFFAQFIMRFFFSWMVIYTPIYLHDYIGFDWSVIGVMFTIMLLPYLFIELPAGRLADTWLGEKELLIGGFLITALGTALMSFSVEANILIWIGILLLTRIGASLLEIMTESYFFKHVDSSETDTISLFRIARPLAYFVGPIAATVMLFIVDFRYIFIALAAILLSGIYFSISLRDTR